MLSITIASPRPRVPILSDRDDVFMAKPKQPAVPAMTLANTVSLASTISLHPACDACRHTALINVSIYPAETEVPAFRSRVKCAKCGSRGNKIDVRPNWKEQPTQPSLTGKQWR